MMVYSRFCWTAVMLSVMSLPRSHSGVISDLTKDQEESVLKLYHKSCGNGRYGSSTSVELPSRPNVNILCKEPREYVSPEQDKKIIRIPAQASTPKKNLIFVEVPETTFKHQITLVPAPGNNEKPSKIFVLPQQSTHDVHVEDIRYGVGGVLKPAVFFLKSPHYLNTGGQNHHQYGVAPYYSNNEQLISETSPKVWIPSTRSSLPKRPARYVQPPSLDSYVAHW